MVPDVGGILCVSTPGKQPMAREDRFRDLHELAVRVASLRSEHLEGHPLLDGMAFHQDALGPLGDRSPGERTLEVVVLGEPSKHDVDRALELTRVLNTGDVSEDPPLGRLPV